jgi:16S rRNA processing protein RimM
MSPRRIGPINRQNNETGSPTPGEPVFVMVGQMCKPHGVKGEILMEIQTDFPQRLRTGKEIYIGPEHKPFRIASRRLVEKGLLLSFSGFDDCDQVAVLTNQAAFVRADSLPALPEGEYYHHQLLGLLVCDQAGTPLGKLGEIIETGANDVYVVQAADGKEILLPVVPEVILEVNLKAGVMKVNPPEWQ